LGTLGIWAFGVVVGFVVAEVKVGAELDGFD